MRRIKVKDNQTLFDISIQEYGTAIYVVVIAFKNDISITDILEPGQELIIPEGLPTDEKMLTYYADNKIIPATAQLTIEIEEIVADEDIDVLEGTPIIPFDPTFSNAFG